MENLGKHFGNLFSIRLNWKSQSSLLGIDDPANFSHEDRHPEPQVLNRRNSESLNTRKEAPKVESANEFNELR